MSTSDSYRSGVVSIVVQQQPDPGQPGWSSMLSVPAVVARQLKGEPLLLTCVGVAALLTVFGLFGPPGGALYAWLLAGLAVVFGVLWTLARLPGTRARRNKPAGGTGTTAPAAGSNVVDLPGRSELGPVRMRARRGNSFTGGRRVRIERLDMEAGLPAADLDPPHRAAGPSAVDGPATPGGPAEGPAGEGRN